MESRGGYPGHPWQAFRTPRRNLMNKLTKEELEQMEQAVLENGNRTTFNDLEVMPLIQMSRLYLEVKPVVEAARAYVVKAREKEWTISEWHTLDEAVEALEKTRKNQP
jgi:hypothetical protein